MSQPSQTTAPSLAAVARVVLGAGALVVALSTSLWSQRVVRAGAAEPARNSAPSMHAGDETLPSCQSDEST